MTYVYEQFDHLFQVGKSVYIRLTSQKDGCHQNLNDCARGKRDCSTRHVGLDRMTSGKITNNFGIAALKPSTKQKLTILRRKRMMTWMQRLMVASAGGKKQKGLRRSPARKILFPTSPAQAAVDKPRPAMIKPTFLQNSLHSNVPTMENLRTLSKVLRTHSWKFIQCLRFLRSPARGVGSS